MKHGDRVIAFTGATGQVVELLSGECVRVALTLHPRSAFGKTQPVPCECVYLRSDVKVLPSNDARMST